MAQAMIRSSPQVWLVGKPEIDIFGSGLPTYIEKLYVSPYRRD